MENEEREKINLKTGLSSKEVQKRIEENLSKVLSCDQDEGI